MLSANLFTKQLRYSVRSLLGDRTFVIACFLTLLVGVGSCFSSYVVVDFLVAHPLPFREEDRLVSVKDRNVHNSTEKALVAPGTIDSLRSSGPFQTVSGFYPQNASVQLGELPVEAKTLRVTPQFFQTLDMRPLLGRWFSPEEDAFGGPAAVIVTYGFWRNRLGGDSAVIGRNISLDGVPTRIVGVMPKQFSLLRPVDMWVPAALNPWLLHNPRAHILEVVGRLAPHLTTPKAQSALTQLGTTLALASPIDRAGRQLELQSLSDAAIGETKRASVLIFFASSAVFSLCLLNLALLFLQKRESDQSGDALRLALGATRFRLSGLYFMRAAVMATVSGFAAIGLTVLLLQWIKRSTGNILLYAEQLHLNWRTVSFPFILCILATAVPVLISDRYLRNAGPEQLMTSIKLYSFNRAPNRGRALVLFQISLTFMLLCWTGVILRDWSDLHNLDLGYSADQVYTFNVSFPWTTSQEQSVESYKRMLRLIGERSVVQSISYTDTLPLTPGVRSSPLVLNEDRAVPDSARPSVEERIVAPAYLKTVRLPLLAGHDFDMSDDLNKAPVVLVNESFADRFFPHQNPENRFILLGTAGYEKRFRIVGVIGNMRSGGLREPASPLIMHSALQENWPEANFVVRSTAPANVVQQAVRESVALAKPGQAINNFHPLQEEINAAYNLTRVQGIVLTLLSFSAIVLASTGVYGMQAIESTRRAHEIAVKLALGASRRVIASEFVVRGVFTLIAGVGFGVVAVGIFNPLLMRWLEGAKGPTFFVFVCATLIVAANVTLATSLPTLRAVYQNPWKLLREQ